MRTLSYNFEEICVPPPAYQVLTNSDGEDQRGKYNQSFYLVQVVYPWPLQRFHDVHSASHLRPGNYTILDNILSLPQSLMSNIPRSTIPQIWCTFSASHHAKGKEHRIKKTVSFTVKRMTATDPTLHFSQQCDLFLWASISSKEWEIAVPISQVTEYCFNYLCD